MTNYVCMYISLNGSVSYENGKSLIKSVNIDDDLGTQLSKEIEMYHRRS